MTMLPLYWKKIALMTPEKFWLKPSSVKASKLYFVHIRWFSLLLGK